MRRKTQILCCLLVVLLIPASALGAAPWQSRGQTAYMALGDSLAAGTGAIPATQGYVYLLYREGVFDTIPNTQFADAAVPGATSQDVLDYQVPQALYVFQPTVITLTVGGDDLLSILNGADEETVLANFQTNLTAILAELQNATCDAQLCLPGVRIYVSNLYSIPEIPGADEAVSAYNRIVAQVAESFGVPVADVYSAFQGRSGLLLLERHGADFSEVHPTNAGYRTIADAFKSVIR